MRRTSGRPLAGTTRRPPASRRDASRRSNARYRRGWLSALAVLVVAAPPDAALVASVGSAVEPLIHAPEGIDSARVCGIGVVDDAVLERERAQARSLTRVRGHVGSGHGREGHGPLVGVLDGLAPFRL